MCWKFFEGPHEQEGIGDMPFGQVRIEFQRARQ
jgi:hypothetical protein